MKNRGFTLIELLAVMVILGVLTLIVTISTGPTINNSKAKLTEIQIQKVKEAAKIYYLNEGINSFDYNLDINKTCVNVDYLVENDYMEKIELGDLDEKETLGSIKIIYKSEAYTYEYKDTDCSYSDYIVSVDEICELKSENPNEIGTKYQCKVKKEMEEGFEDGYYFYVLSNNENGTVNLIMDRNIYYDSENDIGLAATSSNSNVAWYASPDSSNGPVIAMTYLHNATKDWNIIPNIQIDYKDENIHYSTGAKGTNGYGGIKTTNDETVITTKDGDVTLKLQNLKARMPRYDEVHGEGKCLKYLENGNQYGSCPLWLVNYLESSSMYPTTSGKIEINGIQGYWALSTDSIYAYTAIRISHQGIISYDSTRHTNLYGVRPVITLAK